MKTKELLLLLISTFIIVVTWIIFNIYHSSAKSTISEKLNIQIVNINPSFDTNALEKLKERRRVDPTFEIVKESSESVVLSKELKENESENLENTKNE